MVFVSSLRRRRKDSASVQGDLLDLWRLATLRDLSLPAAVVDYGPRGLAFLSVSWHFAPFGGSVWVGGERIMSCVSNDHASHPLCTEK